MHRFCYERDQQVEQRLISMIIPKLHFFQVKREPFLGDAMEFDDAFLGVTPESFNAIDVDLPIAKMFAMVKVDMPVTTEHKGIIALELVRVNNATTPNHLDRQIQQRLGLDVHMDTAVPLEDAEYGNFVGRSASALAFALTSEIGFIQFDRPVHPIRRFDGIPNRLPNELDGLQSCGITQSNLLGNPTCGNLQFKELDDPQPLLRADLDTIQPTVAEVMEGVLTPRATVPFTKQPINFIAVTPTAKNMPFFPTEFTQVQPGTFFTFYDELKGF